jgi:molecular chaperone HscB
VSDPGEDPFDVLGLAPHFALDNATLDQRVRELSRALHPDRYASSPAGERRRALSRAIDVNEAQRALKDPLRRAEILRARLARVVVPAAQQAPASASPALLMEMMELREALAAKRQSADLKGAQALAAPLQQRVAALENDLAHLFEAGFSQGTVDYARLDSKVVELRYLRRFLDEVMAMEDDA